MSCDAIRTYYRRWDEHRASRIERTFEFGPSTGPSRQIRPGCRAAQAESRCRALHAIGMSVAGPGRPEARIPRQGRKGDRLAVVATCRDGRSYPGHAPCTTRTSPVLPAGCPVVPPRRGGPVDLRRARGGAGPPGGRGRRRCVDHRWVAQRRGHRWPRRGAPLRRNRDRQPHARRHSRALPSGATRRTGAARASMAQAERRSAASTGPASSGRSSSLPRSAAPPRGRSPFLSAKRPVRGARRPPGRGFSATAGAAACFELMTAA